MKIKAKTVRDIRTMTDAMVARGLTKKEITEKFMQFEFIINQIELNYWDKETLIPYLAVTVANDYLKELQYQKILKGAK